MPAPLLSGLPGAAGPAEEPRWCLSGSEGNSERGGGSAALRLPAGSEAGSPGGGASLPAPGAHTRPEEVERTVRAMNFQERIFSRASAVVSVQSHGRRSGEGVEFVTA